MRLDPEANWIIGRAMVFRREGSIIDPTERHGVTRCYLIECVGSGANGYAPGEIVVAHKIFDMILKGGHADRVVFQSTEVICRVRDVALDQFVDLQGNPIEEQEAAA